jgi:phosphate:Na+ symporter
MPDTTELSLGPLFIGLFGGLSLFLFGMDQLATALKAVAGEQMRKILARLTANRVLAVLTGAFVTAVIQSSSVTTVIVVGFVSAGLMSVPQSIGVIMGANIGTTITAQIVAFQVTKAALLLVTVGFSMLFLGRTERTRRHGSLVMGLGLIFFGMNVMGEAMLPLHSYEPFLVWMSRMENPALGIVAGALFTALVQSSSAATGVVIVMASQGFISLSAGIALSFGANVGTCVTALLAAAGKPRESLRAATVHVLFNVGGVVVWLFFIDPLAAFVTWLSPQAPELQGVARMAAETPRQIANAHTTFNVANTLLFLPFSIQFARLVEWLVPDRPREPEEEIRARYLDVELVPTPALALDRARMEIVHLGEHVQAMMAAILPAMISGTRESLDEVQKMDDSVDVLHGKIITYLGKISQVPLTDVETEDFLRLMEATNDLENIGDIIETNLAALGRERISERVRISEATKEVIGAFHAAVASALDEAMVAATKHDTAAAQRVVDMKKEINRLAGSAALHEARRLVAEEPNRLSAYTVEMDILENLKRVYYFCKRIARGVVSKEPAP